MDVTIPCPCPDSRHEHDTVTLRDRLDFRSGVTMRKSIAVLYGDDPDASTADVLAVLTEGYMLLGIASWTLVDARGKPIEPSKAAIRSFMDDHVDIAMTVGDAADDLYGEQVLLPLLERARTSSPGMPTNGSTSATNGSSEKPPKPSKRSSTSTTPTADTEPITLSPAGDSSSSQNSASAA